VSSNPFDEFDDLRMLLFRQDGVIGRRQALTLLTRAAVEHRLSRGTWRLAHRAVYVVGGTEILGDAQRRWVALLAAGADRPAVLGGVSALGVAGLRGFGATAVHVLVPARYRDHDPPVFSVVHRTSTLRQDDVLHNAEPPCTVVGRSVVDAAQWAGSDPLAAAVVAAAFQQRLVTLAEVEAAAARQPRARRRSLLLDVARDAAGGAHSLPEVEFLRLCRRHGLPRPKCQVSRVDRAGRRRYLDAYFEEYGLHVEIDGDQHLEVQARWSDMKRQNDLWIAGDRILRFPSRVVRHRPDEVAAQMRTALLAAGWRP
jgi:hypothetical protein